MGAKILVLSSRKGGSRLESGWEQNPMMALKMMVKMDKNGQKYRSCKRENSGSSRDYRVEGEEEVKQKNIYSIGSTCQLMLHVTHSVNSVHQSMQHHVYHWFTCRPNATCHV